MATRRAGIWLATGLLSAALLTAFQSGPGPETRLAQLVKDWLSASADTEWGSLDSLPGFTWKALPPHDHAGCLPDGSCYSRQGTLRIGGRSLTAVATGSRTMVFNLYLRNPAAALGERSLLASLHGAGFSTELGRCPVPGGAGGTNWYRIKGDGLAPGSLSIQTSCAGKPCEAFVIARGEKLLPLAPNQTAMYSEQCSEGAGRKAVAAAGKPHELLAEVLKVLIPAMNSGEVSWNAMRGLPAGIVWTGEGPTPADLTSRQDPNPMMQSGQLTLNGREFSLMASGTASEAKTFYFEELGLHPRGEHMLGVLYQKGFVIELVRCGPVYTESTNNWYRVTSPRTRRVMVRQSIRYDGNRVQDSYELRLDGSLPSRDPRDRNPGVNGCR
jgi:hypothetical protein